MISELVSIFMEFFEELLLHLESNISEIPFTISFGAAILLTIMFIIHHISAPIIKMRILPAWFCAAITYFFPTIIPKEHETASLIIFGAVIFITIEAYRHLSKRSHSP